MIYIRNDSNLPDEDAVKLISCLNIAPITFEPAQSDEFTFVVANYKEGDPMPCFPSVIVNIDDQTYSVSLKSKNEYHAMVYASFQKIMGFPRSPTL